MTAGEALRLRPGGAVARTLAESIPDGASAIDLHDPSRTCSLGPGDMDNPAAALGPGAWFVLPRLDGRKARTPRPLAVEWPRGTEVFGVSLAMREAELRPARDARTAAFAQHVRSNPSEGDLEAIGKLVDRLGEVGAGASLDQVQALGRCSAVTVRLLLGAGTDRLAGWRSRRRANRSGP